MKKSIFVVFMCFSFLLTCSMFTGRNFYHVVFKENPELSDNSVYNETEKIGKILNKSINDNAFVLTIAINSNAVHLMKTGTAFYIENAHLMYGNSGGTGEALKEKVYILGLPSKKEFSWLKRSNTANSQYGFFYVAFENAPELSNQSIYSKEIEIGNIYDKDLGKKNELIFTIGIKREYLLLLTKNTVFVVKNGVLTLESLEESDEKINEKDYILGFPSTRSLLWFKTKNKLNHFSDISNKKIDELLDKFN